MNTTELLEELDKFLTLDTSVSFAGEYETAKCIRPFCSAI